MAKSLSNLKTLKGDEPVTEKKKKAKFKNDQETANQYGIYSGIVDEKGKTKTNPTESEATKNMVEYLKNNWPAEAETPSNVYRPKFSHTTLNYNRKRKSNSA